MKEPRNFLLRASRDLLLDQIVAPLADTYPLVDLPVRTRNPVVLYNNKAQIIISYFQSDTDYILKDEMGNTMGAALKVEGSELVIETKPLVNEDYTFSVIAVKKATGLTKQLLQTALIKVGVDEDLPLVAEPYNVLSGRPAIIRITGAQGGATYQVFDMDKTEWSKPSDSGKGGDLAIETYPLKENTQLRVLITNNKTKQTGYIITKPQINVYPDEKLVPALTGVEEGIDYNTPAELQIAGSQKSARYQIIFKDIDDDQADKPALANSEMGKPGTGKSTETPLSLKTDKLKEDPTVAVLATNSESGLAIELLTQVFIPVKPDPGCKLTLVETSVKKGESATIKVNTPQRGISYQLIGEDGKKVGWRVYYHKNYGIGKARIGVEFAIDTKEDDSVFLATGPISADTTFGVIATKATTGKTVQLNDTIAVKLS